MAARRLLLALLVLAVAALAQARLGGGLRLVQMTDSLRKGAAAAPSNRSSPAFKTYQVQQPIDHVNSGIHGTFKQRVLFYDEFWAPDPKTGFDGPVFVYTSGESNAEWFWRSAGFVFDLAKEFRALVLFPEHRYYGESKPYGADSLKPEKIHQLSITQALSDIARVIIDAKHRFEVQDGTPVLAIGGSYSGMLAAWMRIRYQHLVDVAVASSAPLYMTGQGYPNPLVQEGSFFARTSQDYEAADIMCPNYIRSAYSSILAAAASPSTGYERLRQNLNLCAAPTSQQDIVELILWTRMALLSMAQVNYPYPSQAADHLRLGGNDSTGDGLPAWPVKESCKLISRALKEGKNVVQALATAVHLYYESIHGKQQCFTPSRDFSYCSDQTGCGDGDEGIAWDYQACTEMVYFPNTNNRTDMFPPSTWDINTLSDYCSKKWGVKPRASYLGVEFGAKNIQYSSNILFTNGHIDPWCTGGVQFNLGPSLIALNYEEGAHHADLNTPHPDDPQAVLAARKQMSDFIKKHIVVNANREDKQNKSGKTPKPKRGHHGKTRSIRSGPVSRETRFVGRRATRKPRGFVNRSPADELRGDAAIKAAAWMIL